MTSADLLSVVGPAIPVIVVGVGILIHARRRWVTRFERGNGRPAIACAICGQKHQRGLPMQFHVDEAHGKKGKK